MDDELTDALREDFIPKNEALAIDASRKNRISKIEQEEIEAKRQIREQKNTIFKYVKRTITSLYFLFLIVVVTYLFCPDFRWAVLTHYHLLAIPAALLIVPSFLLWGIIRGLYNVQPSSKELRDVITAIRQGNPETDD